MKVSNLKLSLICDVTGRSNAVETVSELLYTPKNERDFGTLACWAKNAIGKQTEPCLFQVVPAGESYDLFSQDAVKSQQPLMIRLHNLVSFKKISAFILFSLRLLSSHAQPNQHRYETVPCDHSCRPTCWRVEATVPHRHSP